MPLFLKIFSRRLPLWMGVVFFLITPTLHAAFNGDLYRTQELPALLQKIKTDFAKLSKEQNLRMREIADLKKQIEVYERRVGGNPKKNKDAAAALAEAQNRKSVLEQKVRYYAPKISEQQSQINGLTQTMKQRQSEASQIPRTPIGSWNTAQARQAESVYAAWKNRSAFQLKYYSQRYSTAAENMQESARRENFLTTLKEELKQNERNHLLVLNQLDKAQFHEKAGKMEEERRRIKEENREQERSEPPPVAKPVREVATPAPTRPPAPVIVFTPEPEVPKDFPTRFSEFIEQSPIFVFVILLFTGALGTFVGVYVGHPENKQPLVIGAPLVGLVMAISSFVPFFGFFLGVLLFVISFPAYFKVSMEDLAKVLPLGVGSFLASTVLLMLTAFLFFGA